MTDRELLELAAKACRWVRYGPNEFDPKVGCVTWLDPETGEPHWSDMWNPLTDDGDALRLAVKLEIFTGRFYDCIVPACFASWNNRQRSLWEPAGDDQYAATRRAIVRAAAEIGKAMQ